MLNTRPEKYSERSGKPLSVLLFELAHDEQRQRIGVGDLLMVLDDRAIGALLFVFAVPNIFPVPPGVSTMLGTPLIFLSFQLMLGSRPWLPKFIVNRSLQRSDFEALVRRVIPWLVKAERLLRPRYRLLTVAPFENFTGLICLLLAVVLALPIPLGNTLPAFAISVLALGTLEKDGLWVSAGLLAAGIAVFVVYGVVWAMAAATFGLLAQLFH
ncbi:MAG: hypothetical protein RL297_196 [Pseudomonadota bacterium]|jgi:hypothetical protein